MSEEVLTLTTFSVDESDVSTSTYVPLKCRSLWYLTWASFYPQFQSNPEPDLEVVVCSGYGKNGALSVLQVTPTLPHPDVICCFNAV